MTGKPAACACSTSKRNSSIENCGAKMSVPPGHHAAAAHHLDHVDLSLRPLPHASHDLVRAVDLAAEVAAVATRAGDRRTGGNDPGQVVVSLPLCGSPLHHVEVQVAEVTDCRHASGELPSQRLGDHGVDFFR
jgi:hypothetical protein